MKKISREHQITRSVISLKLLPEKYIVFLQFCQLLWSLSYFNFACDKLKSLLKKRLNEKRTRIWEGIGITVMPNISML
ncbi:hypothetical protein ABHC71_03430 [Ruminococcus bicirculans (ex Wegman et al. 2014)]|uniref:hypothetical protein n=1 Tax=Ruminococcus bicirculans (ex Wegman et al. 2014) TaxID=1160721 RepID=UPI00325A9ECD